MRTALFLIPLIGLTVLAVACDDDGSLEPTATLPAPGSPEATAPTAETPGPPTDGTPTADSETPAAVAETPTAGAETPPATPGPAPVACAAGSGGPFLATQGAADFVVYCPTFLPQGLALQEFTFSPLDPAPPTGTRRPGELNAAFVSSDMRAQVVLYEGQLEASFVSSIVQSAEGEGAAPQTVAYGNLEGVMYAPLTTITDVTLGAFVVVRLPDDITHVLHTAEVDVDTVREIAATMRPVGP
jgi:hypothetical protein